MKKLTGFVLILFLGINMTMAQLVVLEGYVFETGNRGYLNEVNISIFEKNTDRLVTTVLSDPNGYFTARIPGGKTYRITGEKELFEANSVEVVAPPASVQKTIYAKLPLARKPGYVFEVTLAEKRSSPTAPTDAITGAHIEIFNNTTGLPLLDLPNHPTPAFKVNFERGNHYSVLIRKEGYFAKRLEAFVDIKDCILCFEGVGKVTPGIADVMTENNKMGTLLANIELHPIVEQQANLFEKITFDNNSSAISADAQKELNQLVHILNQNPRLQIEIAAHTDSRGKANYNQQLSEKRAQSVANYLLDNGLLNPNQLTYKGYGETQLLNQCGDDVHCEEEQHRENRRVAWKVIGQLPDDGRRQSLQELIMIEQFTFNDYKNSQQIQLSPGEKLTDILKKENKTATEATNEPANSATVEEVTITTELAGNTPERAKEKATIKRNKIPGTYRPTTQPASYTPASSTHSAPPAPDNYVAESTFAPTPPKAGETPINYAGSAKGQTKSIQLTDSGYFIEIMTSMDLLPASHDIFQQHGNIYLVEKENGMYSYLLGGFDEETADFLFQKILSPRYPNASMVYYEKGQPVFYGENQGNSKKSAKLSAPK